MTRQAANDARLGWLQARGHQQKKDSPRLAGIAYRMLGSAMEAEDVIQETYLRYRGVPVETIQSHEALLSTIVTRLCINHLNSAHTRRETYPGPWLPEPILTGSETKPPAAPFPTWPTSFHPQQ